MLEKGFYTVSYVRLTIVQVVKSFVWTLCRRASIDTNSNDGKNQAEALLSELVQKIENTYSNLKAQDSYDLEKSLDFQCAKDDFQVWFDSFLVS